MTLIQDCVDISTLCALRASIRRASELGWDSTFAGELAVGVHGRLSLGRLAARFGSRASSGYVVQHTVAEVWDVLRTHTEAVLSADNPLGLVYRVVHNNSLRFFMRDEGYSNVLGGGRVENCSVTDLGLVEDARGLDYPVDRARMGLRVEDFEQETQDACETPVLSRFIQILKDAGLDHAPAVVAGLTQVAARRGAVMRREVRAWAHEYGLAEELRVDPQTIETVANLMFPRSGKEDRCLLHLVARSVRDGSRLRIPAHISLALRSLRAEHSFEARVLPLPAPMRDYSQPMLDLGMAG